ncbi:hypothetical protein DDQ41_26010 [Streptomyces spongiicola]|uniref:Uncharacterized protein n=1 Tax=Streptomyces spongiicola TaxID=1690221 RepID=A0ABM6VD43_9ACTN|nr:hypothetical protein DDQ41_26010 [Streptomyces spongiicola]
MPSGEADADRYSPLPSDGARSKTGSRGSLSRVETSRARDTAGTCARTPGHSRAATGRRRGSPADAAGSEPTCRQHP